MLTKEETEREFKNIKKFSTDEEWRKWCAIGKLSILIPFCDDEETKQQMVNYHFELLFDCFLMKDFEG